jgi:hypothetical protein
MTKINWYSKKLWIAIIAVLIFALFFHIRCNKHSEDWNMSKDYMWIFKDSIKKDIDTTISFSWVNKRDICNHFIYKGHYLITLWDFKDLYPLNLNDVVINTNVTIKDIDTYYGKGEVLDSKGSPKTVVKFGRTFHTKININLDYNSKIINNLSSKNYKGFYGIVNEMSFTNESEEDYIQFIYPDGKIPTLLLLYKNMNGFYVIIIESNDNINFKFDDTILEILNLEK